MVGPSMLTLLPTITGQARDRRFRTMLPCVQSFSDPRIRRRLTLSSSISAQWLPRPELIPQKDLTAQSNILTLPSAFPEIYSISGCPNNPAGHNRPAYSQDLKTGMPGQEKGKRYLYHPEVQQ